MSLFQNLFGDVSRFEQRTVKFAEAAILRDAAATLSKAVTEIDKLILDVPTEATAILAAVENADKAVLGVEATAVNLFLSSVQVDIVAEIEKILAEVEGYTQKVVTAANNLATKLAAEAQAA